MSKSIFDIARKAGCSTATVSRVINGSAQVSEETKENILRVIEECNYVPRRQSRGLANSLKQNGRGTALELVFCLKPLVENIKFDGKEVEVESLKGSVGGEALFKRDFHFGSTFYRMICEGVMEEAANWSLKVSMRTVSDLKPETARSLFDGDGTCGVFLAGNYMEGLEDFVESCGLPLVLVDLMTGQGAPEISIDNFYGIGEAFDYLRGLGHARIGFLKGSDNPAYRERHAAYLYKMAEAGLSPVKDWTYEGPNHVLHVAEWGARILSAAERPTAFLSSNDFAALGMMRAASSLGVRIPEDLSIVGFDDVEPAELVTPPLTSVRVSMKEIGREAVRQMALLLQSRDNEPGEAQRRIRLLPKLIKRSSAAEPRKA